MGIEDERSFGARIRAARSRLRTPDGRQWTQDDLAQAVGVQRNTVSRWENGGMLPKDPAKIADLARLLHVGVDWLLGSFEHRANPASGPEHAGVLQERGPRYGDPYDPQPQGAEGLPAGASDLVLRYLERMKQVGCSTKQVAEGERLLVLGARNSLATKAFEDRELEEILTDIDASWDFVVHVLRRHGIRP